MARRRREDTARSSGPSDVLVVGMVVILTGGFALFAFPDLFKNILGAGSGTGCSVAANRTASVNAIATAIGTYVRNHLSKATTWTGNQVIARIKAGYPSGLNSLATQNACKTALPSGNGGFWKLLADITIKGATLVPPAGQTLSSGALAAMNQMKIDGGRTHFTGMALSYPGLSEFELQNIAKDFGYQFSKNYAQYGRAFVGIAEDDEIVKKAANVEDYSEVTRDIEAL